MADELNIPTHRWRQKQNHVRLARQDFSRKFIYASGIEKIDAFAAGEPAPDTTAPTVSSVVLASDGVTLTVTFNEALDTGNDTAAGEWAVSASSTTTSVSTAAIDTGSTTDVTLTLGTAVTDGETVTVDYSGTSLRDAAGNQVATFTGQAVTNNSTQTGATFPQSLYAADEPGFVVNASDLSSLWQDDGATTAVTTDGDPVALTQDLSGSANGVDHSTSVSAERPTYETDGTLHWIENDGIDDALNSPTNLDMTGTDTFTMVFSVRSLETGGTRAIFYRHNPANGNKIIEIPFDGTNHIRIFTRQSNSLDCYETGASFAPPVDVVLRVEGDIPNDRMRVWLDGTLVSTKTGYGTADNWKSQISELFISGGKVRLYGGFMIGRLLTTSEQSEADTWAGDLQGRTL